MSSAVVIDPITSHWKDGLHSIRPNYFGGIVSNADEVLEKHKVATQSCFGTRSSVKKDIQEDLGQHQPTKKVL